MWSVNRKHLFILAGVTAAIALVVVAFLLWGDALLEMFRDADTLKDVVHSAGPFGPLVFITLQILQVFFAPIPGQVTGLAGGFLFGSALGLIYTVIGATIGFTLIFLLARRFGRPFVERMFSKKHVERFDYITKETGPMALFLIFLLPAFPDDLVCYLAGLTKIPIRTLILVSIAGRLPGYIVLTLAGNGLSVENLNPLVALFAALLVVCGLAWWKREWLQGLTKSNDRVAYIRKHWTLSPLATTAWVLALVVVGMLLYGLATAPVLKLEN